VAPERDWPRLVLDSELVAGEVQIRDREVPAREGGSRLCKSIGAAPAESQEKGVRIRHDERQ
jgi:hypothetical protein